MNGNQEMVRAIRDAVAESPLSQREISVKLGHHENWLGRVLRGAIKHPKLRDIEALEDLLWADIDLSNIGNSVIHVRQTLAYASGEYVTGPPKTPRSRRDVPLPEVLVRLLSGRQVQQKAEFVATGARPTHDLVFTTRAGEPLLGTNVTRELQRVLAAAGLPKITYHDLRHVAASNLAARGFTLSEVQAILGHASVTTTGNLYVHVNDEDVARRLRGISW